MSHMPRAMAATTTAMMAYTAFRGKGLDWVGSARSLILRAQWRAEGGLLRKLRPAVGAFLFHLSFDLLSHQLHQAQDIFIALRGVHPGAVLHYTAQPAGSQLSGRMFPGEHDVD